MSEVKWFHTILKEAVENNGMTIKAFCEKSNINYLKTLKVIRGDEQLNEDEIQKICLSGCISKDEGDVLTDAYKFIHISKEKREQIDSIIKILNSIYETVIEKSSFGHGYFEKGNLSKVASQMALEINDQIYKAYTYALKEAFLKGRSSFEFVLFLPDMPLIINEVFHTVKAIMACLDKRVEWKVKCILLKAEDDQNKKNVQMLSLTKYIKLATLSKSIEVSLLENEEKSKVKYGVYFQDRSLFLNRFGEGFILEYKDKRGDFNNLNFSSNDLFEIYYDRDTFNTFVKDTVESHGFLKHNQYSIRSYLSVVSTGDTLNENQIRHKDMAFYHINLYLDKEREILKRKEIAMSQYICESGIQQLLKEGIVLDYSVSGYILNDLERLSLIYDALIKVSLGYDLRLLPMGIKHKYPFLDIINFFELHQKNNQWILARSIPANEYLNRKGMIDSDLMYGLVVKEPYLVASFELFCNHIVNYRTMDTFESVNKIKSLVLKYYKSHGDLKVKSLVEKIRTFDFKES